MAAKNVGRDWEIYRRYCKGVLAPVLAAEYGLSPSRIHQIVANVRSRTPMVAPSDMRADMVRELSEVKAQMHEILDGEPGTKFELDREGNVLAENADQSARLMAAKRIVELDTTIAKICGINAPEQVEATSTVRYEVVGVDPDEI